MKNKKENEKEIAKCTVTINSEEYFPGDVVNALPTYVEYFKLAGGQMFIFDLVGKLATNMIWALSMTHENYIVLLDIPSYEGFYVHGIPGFYEEGVFRPDQGGDTVFVESEIPDAECLYSVEYFPFAYNTKFYGIYRRDMDWEISDREWEIHVFNSFHERAYENLPKPEVREFRDLREGDWGDLGFVNFDIYGAPRCVNLFISGNPGISLSFPFSLKRYNDEKFLKVIESIGLNKLETETFTKVFVGELRASKDGKPFFSVANALERRKMKEILIIHCYGGPQGEVKELVEVPDGVQKFCKSSGTGLSGFQVLVIPIGQAICDEKLKYFPELEEQQRGHILAAYVASI